MRNVNLPGLFVCSICVFASMAISIQYGLGTSEVWWVGLTYAGIGGAAVTWEVIGAHRVAHLHREGRSVARNLCAAGLALATIITVQYELGYLATLFESKASVGESRAGNRDSLERERASMQAQIEKASIVRPQVAIQGDIDGVKAHPRWATSGECVKATIDESRDLCIKYGKLAAELGSAKAVAAAQERIREINAALQPLAGAKVADARASYIAALTGSTEMGARILLSALIILFLFFGRVSAPFVFADPRGGTPTALAGRHGREAVTWDVQTPRQAVLPPPGLLEEPGTAEDEFDADEFQAMFEIEREQELLARINAGREPQPDPLTDLVPMDPKKRRAHEIVRSFIKDACVVDVHDQNHMERGALLYDGFKVWRDGYFRSAESEAVEMLDANTFGGAVKEVLAHMGGRKKQTAAGNAYVGLMLRPSVVKRVAQEAKPVEDKTIAPRRLGGYSQDRRMMDDAPVAGTA